jgi:hypothetical protein
VRESEWESERESERGRGRPAGGGAANVVSKQRIRMANEKHSKNITQRGNAAKTSETPPRRRRLWDPGCWRSSFLSSAARQFSRLFRVSGRACEVTWLSLRCFHSSVNFNLNSFPMFDTLIQNSVKHPASEWLSYHPSWVIQGFFTSHSRFF